MQLVRLTIPAGLSDEQALAYVNALLGGLVEADRLLLKWGLVPRLYDSGVRYVAESGTEIFADALTASRRRRGDCAHLAAWRAAEVPGGKLRLYMRRNGRRKTIHVQVRHPNGRIEDPSRFLGMAPGAE